MAETLNNEQKGVLSNFHRKAREFWSLWAGLEKRKGDVTNQPAAIRKEYSDLINRGVSIRGKIEWITGIIDGASNAYQSVKDWLSENVGLGDVSYDRLAGLGFIPLIPIAVIAGSVATIGYWVTDAYKFTAKLDEIKRLERKGLSPEKAARIVERTLGKKGLLSGLGSSLLLPLALAAGAIYMIKKG